MGLFGRLLWRIAAKRYARRLSPILLQRYGAAETYTTGQIRAAATKAGLNQRFLALGFAAFLCESHYNAACSDLELRLPHSEARALFERFKPSKPHSAWMEPPPERSNMV